MLLSGRHPVNERSLGCRPRPAALEELEGLMQARPAPSDHGLPATLPTAQERIGRGLAICRALRAVGLQCRQPCCAIDRANMVE